MVWCIHLLHCIVSAILHYITLYYIILHYFILPYIMSFFITLFYIMSYNVVFSLYFVIILLLYKNVVIHYTVSFDIVSYYSIS